MFALHSTLLYHRYCAPSFLEKLQNHPFYILLPPYQIRVWKSLYPFYPLLPKPIELFEAFGVPLPTSGNLGCSQVGGLQAPGLERRQGRHQHGIRRPGTSAKGGNTVASRKPKGQKVSCLFNERYHFNFLARSYRSTGATPKAGSIPWSARLGWGPGRHNHKP